MTARDPLRLLFLGIAAELVMVVGSWLAPATAPSFALQRWIFFALGAAEVAGIAWMQRLRRGAASDRLWTWALIAAGADAAIGLWWTSRGFSAALVPMLAGAAETALLWLALARDAGPERVGRLTPLVLALVAVRLAVASVRMWMSTQWLPSRPDEIGSTMAALGWASLLLSVAVRALLLLAIFRLLSVEESAVQPQQRS